MRKRVAFFFANARRGPHPCRPPTRLLDPVGSAKSSYGSVPGLAAKHCRQWTPAGDRLGRTSFPRDPPALDGREALRPYEGQIAHAKPAARRPFERSAGPRGLVRGAQPSCRWPYTPFVLAKPLSSSVVIGFPRSRPAGWLGKGHKGHKNG